MLYRLDAAHSGVVAFAVVGGEGGWRGVGPRRRGAQDLGCAAGDDLPHEDEGEAKAAQSMADFYTFIDGAEGAHAEEEAAVAA